MGQDDASGRTGGESPFSRGVTEPSADELAFQPVWAHKDQVAKMLPMAGVTMQALRGGKLMLNWVTIEPNSVVPRHQHPHEQMGVMLEGALELTIGSESRLLRPGDAYAIPPNLPHSASTGAEGCIVLDVFTPPRDDYVTE
jgi:quercetin dioxygenase-like cupin family protein